MERKSKFGDWLISLDIFHHYSVENVKTGELINEGIISVSQLISKTFPAFNATEAIKILSKSN